MKHHYYIENGDLFKGDFPNNGKLLVKEFVNKYSIELLDMWQT